MTKEASGDPDFEAALERLARTPVLLVASDYDGTLAQIVDDPREAHPEREALVALAALARLPQTSTAVLSGRALSDLAALTGAPPGLLLVGSHGSEFDVGFAERLNPVETALRDRLRAELTSIAARTQGLSVEPKPAGAAFHYRRAEAGAAASALAEVMAGPAALGGVHQKRGKCVLELSVVPTDKGHALGRMRAEVGASAVVFFGDDVTDEDAFATLHGPDVAVKVGPGTSAASWRVDGPAEVAEWLARLCERRAAHFGAVGAPPIEQLSLLSDQRTVALVTPAARIVWFCAPRIDSPALFAELLGGATAGHFAVEPVDGSAPLHQRYGERDLVLTTQFASFAVTDFLDTSGGRATQRAGRTDLVRVIEGQGTVRLRFAPRLDFGRQTTRLEAREGGLAVLDSLDPVLLRSPGVDWTLAREGKHHTAEAIVQLGPEPLVLELRYGAGDLRPAGRSPTQRREQTSRHWSQWSEGLELPHRERGALLRSALTLKALQYGPSGAIAAAATTSLPECLGGVRNWDYRFAWPRDAALAARALAELGSPSEGMALLDWLLGILDGLSAPDRLRPIYTVTGAELGSEGEIAELAGYGGSRPVRVGNGASGQVQLDVFGPIADLIATLAKAGAPLSSEHARLCEAMAEAVAKRWRDPDHGIWEIRAPARHHVHTKVMCWLALDRSRTVLEQHFARPRPELAAIADELAAEVLERGWNPKLRAFTAAYGSDDLDAAVLQIGLAGFLDPRDPRFVETVAAIERELREGPTVYRYRADDGLPGREGGFHLLTAWLAEAHLALGQRERAEELLEGLLNLRGATGLLSEQYDPVGTRALGNHPQAYSHLGLVGLILALDRAPPARDAAAHP